MSSRWKPLVAGFLVLALSASGFAGLPSVNVTGRRFHVPPPAPTRWQAPAALSAITAAGQSSRLTAVGADGVARVWEAANGREVGRFAGAAGALTRVALSPDGRTLAMARPDGRVVVWEVDSARKLHEFEAVPAETVLALAFAADGRTLVAVSTRGRASNAIIFSIAVEPAFIPTILPLDMPQMQLPEVKFEILKGIDVKDPKVEIKDLKLEVKDAKVEVLPVQVDVIRTLAFSPDGTTLAWGASSIVSEDATLHIRRWDLPTGKPTSDMTIRDERRLARSIVSAGAAAPVLSADGRLLALSDGAEALSVWDLVAGRPVADFQTAGPVTAIAFSPDGRNLAVGSAQKIAIHEVLTGKERGQLRGPATCLAFTADGKTLAAGLADGAVQLWDTITCRDLGRRHGHSAAVTSVTFVAGGKTLVAAASPPHGSPVRLWDVSTGKTTKAQTTEVIVSTGNVQTTEVMWYRPVKQTPETTTQVVAWNVSDVKPDRPATRAKAEALWDDLGAEDAGRAYQAICALPARSTDVLALLHERLHPVPVPDPEQMARLIADLDDDRFAVRQRATEELRRLGEAAAPQLREVLTRQPCLDKRLRVEALLRWLTNPWVPSSKEMQAMRAVEVLERIATPDARQLLERLAKGAAHAPLTQHAKASLQRLAASLP